MQIKLHGTKKSPTHPKRARLSPLRDFAAAFVLTQPVQGKVAPSFTGERTASN